jgi:hypothetical protein
MLKRRRHMEDNEAVHDNDAPQVDNGPPDWDNLVTAPEVPDLDEPPMLLGLLILEGALVGWKMPGPPKNYQRKKDPPSVPAFETVDNPGFWDDFVFQPKYDKKKNYLGHSLLTGAMPVPEKNGKRQCNGWEFHYQG